MLYSEGLSFIFYFFKKNGLLKQVHQSFSVEWAGPLCPSQKVQLGGEARDGVSEEKEQRCFLDAIPGSAG